VEQVDDRGLAAAQAVDLDRVGVDLEGAVSCPGNSNGASIFEMPAQYRPAQDVRFAMLGAGLSLAQSGW
jgi:hypothetical protein